MKRTIWILSLILAAFSVNAHEGHGIVEHGPAHYVFTPEHGMYTLGVVLIIAILWFFVVKYKKSKKRNA
ncbi:MAG TPA: hypothetical protein DDY13_17790 [Cytophagales bacterium]|jgi:uncharacterized membrane protein|nr:hypothetical protein [Cytophagales bacterium]